MTIETSENKVSVPAGTFTYFLKFIPSLILTVVFGMCFLSLPDTALCQSLQKDNAIQTDLHLLNIYDGRGRITLAKEYLSGSNDEDFDNASYLLRKIVADGQEEQLFEAFYLMGLMHEELWAKYAATAEKQYQPHHSIGFILLSRGFDTDKALSVLIQEGSILNMQVQQTLRFLYESGYDDIPRYDRRIPKFFKQAAIEGIPRSMLVYGEILVGGMGVPAKPTKGIGLLKKCNFEEAKFLLGQTSSSISK